MKKLVVIVEDEMSIAEAQRMILEQDFNVHLASDGEEGLRKVRALKPDLVVLDLMIPKIDGLEVCKRIRSDSNLHATKIVMVTAKNAQEDESIGMDLGADDYIMKPFEPAELLQVAHQVLKR